MTLPRALTSRTAALTALAVASLLCIGIAVLAVVSMRNSVREDEAENLRLLASYRSEIAAGRGAADAYAEMKTRIGAMPSLLHADDGARAAALMQTLVKKLVESNGGELRTAQVLAPARENGFETVSLQCDVTLPASRLRDLAYAIETTSPYLFVETADITAPMSLEKNGDADPTFDAVFVLRAYRWPVPR
jgi:hypothetical protein